MTVPTAADRVRVDTVRVDVVDTIGTGDTFMASLIHAVLARGDAGYDAEALRSMGEAAGRVAAITVSRTSVDLPWKDELESPVRERRQPSTSARLPSRSRHAGARPRRVNVVRLALGGGQASRAGLALPVRPHTIRGTP